MVQLKVIRAALDLNQEQLAILMGNTFYAERATELGKRDIRAKEIENLTKLGISEDFLKKSEPVSLGDNIKTIKKRAKIKLEIAKRRKRKL